MIPVQLYISVFTWNGRYHHAEQKSREPLWTPAQKAEKAKWLEIFQAKLLGQKAHAHRHSHTHMYMYVCMYIYIYISLSHSLAVVEQKQKMYLTEIPFIYQQSVTFDLNIWLPKGGTS